jgi:putative glycosyltransferase (TIGR04372 family)
MSTLATKLSKFFNSPLRMSNGILNLLLFYLKVCFSVILSLPYVIVFTLLRPVVHVRLYGIDTGRLGTFYYAEWYEQMKEQLYNSEKRTWDFFYFFCSTNAVANHYWLKLWKRKVNWIWGGSFLYYSMKYLRFFDHHRIPIHSHKNLQHDTRALELLWNSNKTIISLTKEEVSKGDEILRSSGIDPNKKFICFHARDSQFLNKVLPSSDWSYHNFRDSDIDNYVEAVEKFLPDDFLAFRMGATVEKSITTEHRGIIDYACSELRSDFMDIYLAYKCYFFVVSSTGVSTLPEKFKKPIVYVNWPCYEDQQNFQLETLTIFKRFYLHDEKRYLAVKEIVEKKLHRIAKASELIPHGLSMHENSCEELYQAMCEMHRRLQGTWLEDEESNQLTLQFYRDLGKEFMFSKSRYWLGSDFLKKNKTWLFREKK